MNDYDNFPDVYENYFDYYDYENNSDEFPIVVTWTNPEDGEKRRRKLRSIDESDEFFGWFLKKYPDIKYSVD